MGEFATHRAGIAERREGGADLLTIQAGVVMDAAQPVAGPAQHRHELARQAKGQIEAPHPGAGQRQALTPGIQVVKALQPLDQHTATVQRAGGQHNGFAPRRRTGEIATEQRGHGSDVLPPGRPKAKQSPCGGIMPCR
ncbi:hypothetical protein FQZ97_1162740 [compost metagenome]